MTRLHRGATPEERFWNHVELRGDDECWNWTACKDTYGYGQLSVDRRMVLAHRYAFALRHGPIERGLYVLHTCDNRACCNPAHLYAGTALDNARDRDARKRRIPPVGEAHGQARLTLSQVRQILSLRGVLPRRDIAVRFAISPTRVSDIHHGRGWQSALAQAEADNE